MKVTVKLFASLRDYLPPEADSSSQVMEIDPQATVGEILARLGIPENIKLIILVNAAHAPKERPLQDGDVMAVFPPIAGG